MPCLHGQAGASPSGRGSGLYPKVKRANCYRNTLRLADGHGIKSIAFPAISTGVFGYPVEEAAEVALQAVAEVAPSLKHVRLIRFVLWDEAALRPHCDALGRLGSQGLSLSDDLTQTRMKPEKVF